MIGRDGKENEVEEAKTSEWPKQNNHEEERRKKKNGREEEDEGLRMTESKIIEMQK